MAPMRVPCDLRKSHWLLLLIIGTLCCVARAFGQTDTATISGYITDQSGAVISGAAIKLTNVETNTDVSQSSNGSGLYVFTSVKPGHYRIVVQKPRFREIALTDMTVNVQDLLSRNFRMQVGSVGESITVNGNIAYINTVSGTVSTVVDQQFVDNMPLNGRSFQSLIALTPGVMFVTTGLADNQFVVNGQRPDANYFMVDGVSANFGVAATFDITETLGGTTPAFTAAGGTNGLVSVDAMQEFRIQTSTYAPEFGRSPGGQISIVTKSGTNQFHGSAFDYLRNDVFDARNWFDMPPLPKPPLRQNDFGGTLGGPLRRDKLFYFLSYEGLRVLIPETASSYFYTTSARQVVAPAYKPYVDALPVPTAPPVDPTCDNVIHPCIAPLIVAYSDPSELNATSLRMDYSINKKINLFGRYDHAPSSESIRHWEEELVDNVATDTATMGATIRFAPTKVNDFRANWSRATGSVIHDLTDFHGAIVPSNSVIFPAPFSPDMGQALVSFPDGDGMEVRVGALSLNTQRQLNFVDGFSWTLGTHQLKTGIDYRHLRPTNGDSTGWSVFPAAFSSLVGGTADFILLDASDHLSVNIDNYSLYAQDTWKAGRRLTLTYGLRWEINPPPSRVAGQPLYVTEGIFNSLPPAVVPGSLWSITFSNLAPRIGAAYQVTPGTVVRGGYGLFYDLGYGDAGVAASNFPYDRNRFTSGPFNPGSTLFQPPPFSTTIGPGVLYIAAFDPHLQLPLTMQWNAAIERTLGSKQTLTATYVGSDGRRLLREDDILPPAFLNLGLAGDIIAIHNLGYSHYNALQVQFQRLLSRGLQALVSYNLSRTSDIGSSDTSGAVAASISQVVPPPLAPANFDLRNTFAGAISYEIPAPLCGGIRNAILKGWAIDGLLRVASQPPINVTVSVTSPELGQYSTQAQVVPGQPYWIPDPTQPNGRALNPNAFTTPAPGATGDFPRNSLRSGYSIDETDLALRRRFNLTRRVNLDIRAEYFNVFNHPMFGAPGDGYVPYSYWGLGPTASLGFGQVTPGYTTNFAMGTGGSGGGQNPLYSVGGPRSGQLTIKVTF
jgi:hypothetical protein